MERVGRTREPLVGALIDDGLQRLPHGAGRRSIVTGGIGDLLEDHFDEVVVSRCPDAAKRLVVLPLLVTGELTALELQDDLAQSQDDLLRRVRVVHALRQSPQSDDGQPDQPITEHCGGSHSGWRVSRAAACVRPCEGWRD
jgi:hypothetical protein